MLNHSTPFLLNVDALAGRCDLPVGLSIEHISPRRYYLEVSAGGSVVSVMSRTPRKMFAQVKNVSTRGTVKGFSPGSRRRLMKLVSSVDRRTHSTRPLFMTLTYPPEYTEDWQQWKRDLDGFLKRLRRRWPVSCIIWRLEMQERGAPHYHLLIFGVRFIPWQWVAKAWFEVVGSGDPGHLAAGTEVRAVRSWHGVMHYVGKYLAKSDKQDLPAGCGRAWGIVGRDNLPVLWLRGEITMAEFVEIKRLIRRLTEARSRGLRYRYRSRHAGTWLIMDWKQGKRLLECMRKVD